MVRTKNWNRAGVVSVAERSVRQGAVSVSARQVAPRGAMRGRLRPALPSSGGLLAIGGLPLSGKNLLAARLVEILPNSAKLETTDDLRQPHEYLGASPGAAPGSRAPLRDLLAQAQKLLEDSPPWAAPIIILAARFDTPAARRNAKLVAKAAGMKFLFVETSSRDIRALRRVPMTLLDPRELTRRLQRYDQALKKYKRVSAEEARSLPGLRLANVLSSFDAAVDRVLEAWK